MRFTPKTPEVKFAQQNLTLYTQVLLEILPMVVEDEDCAIAYQGHK